MQPSQGHQVCLQIYFNSLVEFLLDYTLILFPGEGLPYAPHGGRPGSLNLFSWPQILVLLFFEKRLHSFTDDMFPQKPFGPMPGLKLSQHLNEPPPEINNY